jgi:formate hydrogenlyase subunit 4
VNTFFPFGLSPEWTSGAALLTSTGWYVLKVLLLTAVVALIETANAKMRLFRVPELLAVAFVLAALALVSSFLF